MEDAAATLLSLPVSTLPSAGASRFRFQGYALSASTEAPLAFLETSIAAHQKMIRQFPTKLSAPPPCSRAMALTAHVGLRSVVAPHDETLLRKPSFDRNW